MANTFLMTGASNIQYIPHKQIDKSKWDECITSANNGLIYGYSFYLDYMAKHWDALVLNDYELIMPLTWNQKYGIHYLYQPAFTASLGVFGKNPSEAMVEQFIVAIPKKFQFVEISLNYANLTSSPYTFLSLRTNYVLSLNKNYGDLYKGYRENHQRNIQKSQQSGNIIKKNIRVEDIIHLNKEQLRNISPISDADHEKFKKLCELLFNRNSATTYGVIDHTGNLVSSCIFFFSHKRAYYIMAGNHPQGRNTGASHALIDAFIKDYAANDLLLDFEGSDIESLAMFYNGFGAEKEPYPAIRWNRLPWYLKWLKSKS